MRNKLVAGSLALATALLMQSANAIPVGVTNGAGLFTGINGLDVGGTLYDVAFKDGTFASAVGTFDFTTENAAAIAATAIYSALATVPGLAGLNADPNLMFGCNDTISLGACYIITPYANSALGGIDVVEMRNGRESDNVQNGNNAVNHATSFDTTAFVDFLGGGYVWADWTPAGTVTPPATVPEPGTLTLLLVGGLLAGARQLRRRAK